MQITEGKFYKTRDGRKVGPAEWQSRPEWKEGGYFILGDASRSVWQGGRVYGEKGDDCDDDLIEEWTEPTATPAPAGPVRMVRQIVSGDYGRLRVGSSYGNGLWVEITTDRADGTSILTADELDSVAMTASQLAEAIRGGAFAVENGE